MLGTRSKARFTLLLLEEGELYLDDYAALAYGGDGVQRKTRGRLKLCSASLLFDPDDVRVPVTRLPFSDVQHAELVRDPELLGALPPRTELFSVATTLTMEMKENNANVPYAFRREPALHRFSLSYGSAAQVIARVNELVRARQAGEGARVAAALLEERERAMHFDPSWIRDLDEHRLLELPASRVAPLVLHPGRLLLTQRRLYFQPLNAIDANPVDVFALADVKAVYRRRHTLRRTGVEIAFKRPQASALALPGAAANATAASSVFFSFKSEAKRDEFLALLTAQPDVPRVATAGAVAEATLRWQYGALSNFDYLVELNAAAERTPLDLTQYPVMPWVLADYTSPRLDLANPASFRDLSKPVGALNAQRLAVLKERYNALKEVRSEVPPFLYGTHYSTPGYVLYFLVRLVPELMLRLQNGRFDAPDRMFHSLAETWQGVLSNPSDVKELVPEFFAPPAAFLRNTQALPLGTRSSGAPLGDVLLPPWATDAADFAEKHRAALESEHVSERLHHWVDLIFGYKQRGAEAVKADNVFYYLTYEGAVDVEAVRDKQQRAALETQIQEFGQTPVQLFTRPHPARAPRALRTGAVPSHLLPAAPPPVAAPAPRSPLLAPVPLSPAGGRGGPSPVPSPRLPGGPLPPPASLEELLGQGEAARVSLALTADPGDWGDDEPPSLAALSLPLPAPAPPPALALAPPAAPPAAKPPTRAWTSLGTAGAHRIHRDAVSALWLSRADASVLYSAGHDGALKIFSLAARAQQRSVQLSELALSACVLSADERLALAGSWDNNVYLYSVPYGRVLDTLSAHDDAVSCLALAAPGDVLVTGSWDSTVKQWALRPTGVTRVPLADYTDHDTEVRCVAASPDGRLLASGAADGTLLLADLRARNALRTHRAHNGPVAALAFVDSRLASVGADGCLRVAALAAVDAPLLHSNTGEPLTCVPFIGRRRLLTRRTGACGATGACWRRAAARALCACGTRRAARSWRCWRAGASRWRAWR